MADKLRTLVTPDGKEYDVTVPVENKNVSLAWESTQTVASVDGVNITVTMPKDPWDKTEDELEKIEEQIDNINEALEKKYDKTGGTITGDVQITGNLTVSGSTTTINTETLEVKDNTIVTNSDGNLEQSGLVIKTSANSAYGILYDPADDVVKLGIGEVVNGEFTYTTSEDEIIATREWVEDNTTTNLRNGTGTGAVVQRVDGVDSVATGHGSVALGVETEASGDGAFAYGHKTEASGYRSVAGGYQCVSSGAESYSEGFSNTSSGAQAHSEGSYNNSQGDNSHTEGSNNIASGADSHAGGHFSNASGDAAFSHGFLVNTNSDMQFAVGHCNDNSEENIFEVGNGYPYYKNKNTSSDQLETDKTFGFNGFEVTKDGESKAEKYSTKSSIYNRATLDIYDENNQPVIIPGAIASGFQSVAFGGKRVDKVSSTTALPTEAKGEQSFAQGGGVIVDGAWSAGFGKDTKTYQKAAFAIGGGTQAGWSYADWLSAKGLVDTAANKEKYNKEYSFGLACGESTKALGRASIASGANSIATGANSTAEGFSSQAAGNNSNAKGCRSVASGENSVAQGYESQAHGQVSFASGVCTVANYNHQTVVGRFNENKSNTLFEVGNGVGTGHSDKKPSNAFEVLEDGRAKIKSDAIDNDDIASAGWVDTHKIAEESVNFAWTDNLINQKIDLSNAVIYFDTTKNFNDLIAAGGQAYTTMLVSSTGYKLSVGGPPHVELLDPNGQTHTLIFDYYEDKWSSSAVILPFDFGYVVSIGHADDGYGDTPEQIKQHALTALNVFAPSGVDALVNFNTKEYIEFIDSNMTKGDGALSTEQTGSARGFNFSGYNSNAIAVYPSLASYKKHGAVGPYAASFNSLNHASGSRATALNNKTLAIGDESLAQGYASVAHGNSSFAGGEKTFANGQASFSFGSETQALSDYSFALGFKSTAGNINGKGPGAIALGYRNTAQGEYSTALGAYCTVEGAHSFAGGNGVTVKGLRSFGYGRDLQVNHDNQAVFGKFNRSEGSHILEVGFGESNSNRKNAFVVTTDGRAKVYNGWLQDDDDVVVKWALEDAIKTKTVGPMISIQHHDLVHLRDNAKLVPGQFYRIVDYRTTTTQENTSVTEHRFDIVVQALSESTLSEHAKAYYHDGDSYFGGGSALQIQMKYHIYIDDDGSSSDRTEGYTGKERIVAFDYLQDNTGKTVPVLYATGEDYPDSMPDTEGPYFYVGRVEYNGETHDKWRKIEDDADGYTWSSSQKRFLYTNIITNDAGTEIIPSIVYPTERVTNAKLEAWDLRYCLDNDTNRFAWAHFDGYGVIYYMKDEFGNEAPYDFKNILFRVDSTHFDYELNDVYNNLEGQYVYTFTYVDEEGGIHDASMLNSQVGYQWGGVYNNEIGPYCYIPDESESFRYILPMNIFVIHYLWTQNSSIRNNKIVNESHNNLITYGCNYSVLSGTYDCTLNNVQKSNLYNCYKINNGPSYSLYGCNFDNCNQIDFANCGNISDITFENGCSRISFETAHHALRDCSFGRSCIDLDLTSEDVIQNVVFDSYIEDKVIALESDTHYANSKKVVILE